MTDDDRTGIGPLVVGVDGSASAGGAAAWAAELAAAQQAPVHLVHALPDAAAAAQRSDWLDELAGAARSAGAAPVSAETVRGAPAQVLVDRSDSARMLVVGSYGPGARSGMLAGDLALELVGRAGCPVAVVRGPAPTEQPRRAGPVVAGVDGSASGRAALLLGAELAVALGTGLVALHARPGGSTAEAAALLDAERAAVFAARPGLDVEWEVADDTPLRPLLDRAGTARLLVVGQRGTAPPLTMQQLGSTSRALVEFAPCPVVVART
ncbi:universal stress protein [Pseudonocardia sp. KRD-184]|uniref:Universal stress protein n=1 Tax=Pseudonocardia oceani TaxID=2792013 RepID=A0ABS6UIS8_9PSEU|nr:universal stress protein [Pseudonocardia oceani]MBW0092639.1 universal stress protein [Pseudonocardia oceani]MBW0098840.1 universal stress protein [Pseudonocardia oceani]MBW0111348.1 universal stress protein [Pseudonocardia oceani]MBW0122072.1 universal stress protein [Pseudonocardia oceani]MBW0131744.1 universal stress protein [Pseudonocardia oceani]